MKCAELTTTRVLAFTRLGTPELADSKGQICIEYFESEGITHTHHTEPAMMGLRRDARDLRQVADVVEAAPGRKIHDKVGPLDIEQSCRGLR